MPRRRPDRSSKHARSHAYDLDEPPDRLAGETALSLAAQAIACGDFDQAERCLKLANAYLLALERMLRLRPDAFDWMEVMRRDEAAPHSPPNA